MADDPAPLRHVHEQVRITRLTDATAHGFFGYYDVPPAIEGGRHLCHRVTFRDRLPGPHDVAELGTVATDGSVDFRPFATTTAWNFQQGAMLQRLGPAGNHVLYNTRTDDGAVAVVHDLGTGCTRMLARPVANVSRDGRWGLSISFARLFAFRPGYGYAGLIEPTFDQPQPDADGAWLMDLCSGETKLVVSLAELGERLRGVSASFHGRLLINHITFNPSAERLVMLVRNFRDETHPQWSTAVLTIGRDGTDLRLLGRGTAASHYWWTDDRTLLFWSDGPDGMQHYRVTDAPEPRFECVDRDFFRADGHMSTSPDGRWLIYDSYPDPQRTQHLWLYDLRRRRGVKIARLEALPVPVTDVRCDLHPRWLPDGRSISIDSTHEGFRALYRVDLSALITE